MLEILTGGALNGYKKKTQIQIGKKDKYPQMKRYHYE